jgi:nucleotide-binding universal stress UspA family protein
MRCSRPERGQLEDTDAFDLRQAIRDKAMIKTILVPTGGSDTDFVVFETALAVAHLFGAHLEFFHVHVDVGEAIRYSLHARFARGPGLRNALDELKQESQARSRAGKQHFENFCKRHRLRVADTPGRFLGVSASWHEEPGHEEAPFLTRARAHDLVVMARPSRPNGLPPDLLQQLLFGSGRPILIPTAEMPAKPGGTIMICWKDAAEPTRAIAAAMPLLAKAKRVILTTIEEEHPSTNAAAAAGYLRWHGVRAETQTFKAEGRPVATLLSSVANDCAADLLVMGAYSKSPFQESIFGGCTQTILQHAEVPVFLLH